MWFNLKLGENLNKIWTWKQILHFNIVFHHHCNTKYCMMKLWRLATLYLLKQTIFIRSNVWHDTADINNFIISPDYSNYLDTKQQLADLSLVEVHTCSSETQSTFTRLCSVKYQNLVLLKYKLILNTLF